MLDETDADILKEIMDSFQNLYINIGIDDFNPLQKDYVINFKERFTGELFHMSESRAKIREFYQEDKETFDKWLEDFCDAAASRIGQNLFRKTK